jgi:hypothetical protein
MNQHLKDVVEVGNHIVSVENQEVKTLANHTFVEQFKRLRNLAEKQEVPSELFGYRLTEIREILTMYETGIFKLETVAELTGLLNKNYNNALKQATSQMLQKARDVESYYPFEMEELEELERQIKEEDE